MPPRTSPGGSANSERAARTGPAEGWGHHCGCTPEEAGWRPAGCHLALGSNLGDRAGHLVAAAEALGAHPGVEVIRRAGLFETAAIGGPPEQGRYLNTALLVRTGLAPQALLRLCLDLEQRLGRRRPVPDAPRTIDIDVLLCGDCICNTSDLVLPHPRMHLRRFVLEPLAEIAPEVIHPTLQRSMAELLAGLAPAAVSGQHCVRIDNHSWDRAGNLGAGGRSAR